MTEAKARELLAELFAHIGEGRLVRNTACDGDPGWALRQLPLVQTLQRVDAYLAAVPAPPAGPPREPTREMIDAARYLYFTDPESVWRAMYDAAPAAEPVAQPPPNTLTSGDVASHGSRATTKAAQESVSKRSVASDGSTSNGSDRWVKSGDAYGPSVVPCSDSEPSIPLRRTFPEATPASVDAIAHAAPLPLVTHPEPVAQQPPPRATPEQIRYWLESDEGKYAIGEALKRASAAIVAMNEAREVTPEMLNTPLAAQQPEAPTLAAKLAFPLRYVTVQDVERERADAERIRVLEAENADIRGRSTRRKAELSASRERERSAIALLRESQEYIGGDWRKRRDALLATPDSAASPTGGEG